MRDVSVGTQGLVGANTQACFMSYFSAEGGSANAVLGVFQSLIGASVGMATTWLHNGSALVMAGMMLSSTVCGIVLCGFARIRLGWKTIKKNMFNLQAV